MTRGATPLALVFPGQGSQRHGMLEALPESCTLGRLLDAAEALSGIDLRHVAASGTGDQLSDTRAAQPLLYLADWCWGTALIDAGLTPSAVAGHSLGEIAALAVAEVFSVEAGLELVVERSRAMADCVLDTPGGMMAVLGMETSDVAAAAEAIPGVWVANDNAPGQVVLSGTHEGLEAATRALSEAGAARLVPLRVAGPFHSPLMAPAAEAFAGVLGRTTFSEARFPVHQNTDPSGATSPQRLRERLATQMVSPVRWTETMKAMALSGVTTVVEAGPGTVLKGLARRVDGLRALAVEETGIDTLVEEVC